MRKVSQHSDPCLTILRGHIDPDTITNRHIRALCRNLTTVNDTIVARQYTLLTVRANMGYAQNIVDRGLQEAEAMVSYNLSIEEVVRQMRGNAHGTRSVKPHEGEPGPSRIL